MTTALRAKAISAISPSAASTNVFSLKRPPKPNTPNQIEHRMGLEFQPFIFALIACLPDIEAGYRLDVLGPYSHTPDQKAGHQKIIHFLNALADAGYSNKGTPYWVAENGLTEGQAEAIANAAEAMSDGLKQRQLEIYNNTATTPQKMTEFQERWGAYHAAITGLQNIFPTRRYQQEQRYRFGEMPKTALA